jgi:competence ComEA-like helix-hairpin-helix protein
MAVHPQAPLPERDPPQPLSGEWQRLRQYGGGALLLLCLVLFGWQAWRGRDPAPVGIEAGLPGGGSEIRVQVTGAVVRPGVYRLSPGDRVEDAVRAAGGLTAEAEIERVNLAQRVRDEQRLEIPVLGQATPVPALEGPSGSAGRPAEGPPQGGAVTMAGAPAGVSGPSSTPARVNVNTATAAELEAVPGIGAVSARRILEHREAVGRLRSLDQLREAGVPDSIVRRAASSLAFE